MSFIKKSLSRKVAFMVGVSCFCVTALGLAGMLVLYRSDVEQNIHTSLSILANSMTVAFSTFDTESGRHPIPLFIAEMDTSLPIERARVFDTDGRIVWSLDKTEEGTFAPSSLMARFLAGHNSFVESEDGNTVKIIRHLRARKSCMACHAKAHALAIGDTIGGLEIEIPSSRLLSRINAYMNLQIFIAVLLLLMVTAMTILSLRIFVNVPIQKLTKAVALAEKGDFLTRAQIKSEDEVGQLANAFNNLFAKLTDIQASKIDSEVELGLAQRELKLKAELEKKNEIIEETNVKLTQRVDELELLFDTTRALASTLDLDKILKVINQLIGSTLNYDRFSILLMNRSSKKLVLKHIFGFESKGIVKGMEIQPEEGIIGKAFKTRRRVLIEDLSELDKRVGQLELSLPATGSFLCIPMVHKNNLLGMLTFTREEPHAFSKYELRLLNSLARQAAMAIINAELYQKKLELSVTDELTGLANRRQLQVRLEREQERALRYHSPLSVLMIDIDHFKRYNDVNGHLLGDGVLKGVAQALKNNIRKVDTVARFGGEEFVIILPGQDKQTAASIGEKLRKAVARRDFPRMSCQPNGHISITIGIASFPDDSSNPTDLVDKADLAMYVAKRSGRNRVAIYNDDMETSLHADKKSKKKRKKKKIAIT